MLKLWTAYAVLLFITSPATGAILADAPHVRVRSVATLCDLLLSGSSGLAAEQIEDHLTFFRTVDEILPRLEEFKNTPGTAVFDAVETQVSALGNRKEFVEFIAALARVNTIVIRVLTSQKIATSSTDLRAALDASFVTQPEIIRHLRSRHANLRVGSRVRLYRWLGPSF